MSTQDTQEQMPPDLAATKEAAKTVLAQAVKDGTITRATAETVEAFTVSFVPPTLAGLRLSGMAPDEIAARLRAKRARATRPIERLTADIFLATWEAMSQELAVFAAERAAHGASRRVARRSI